VDQLRDAILAAYPHHDAEPITTVNWYDGHNCIENGQNCLGDNRDTPYIPPAFNLRTHKLLQTMQLRGGEFYVAYGVNHSRTGKALYSNVSVLGWDRKSSPAVVSNEMMEGSAQYYLGSSADPATADKLYAYRIARPTGCGGAPFCLEVPHDCDHGIVWDEPMALVFRAYVETATKAGPAYGEIVIDRIIKFTPKLGGVPQETSEE
jgi:hypothetical protein